MRAASLIALDAGNSLGKRTGSLGSSCATCLEVGREIEKKSASRRVTIEGIAGMM